MTKWVKVTDDEWVTVIDGINGSIFRAPYLKRERQWEVYVADVQTGWQSSQILALYDVNQQLLEMADRTQNRADKLEACSIALTTLIEAYRIGNITADDYAKHTARVYEKLLEFLAEKDEE